MPVFLPEFLKPYAKTVVAVVGAVIAFATLVVTSKSGPITSAEWLSGGITLAAALGVYGVSNSPAEPDEAGQSVLVVALVAAAVCLVLLLALDVIHIS